MPKHLARGVSEEGSSSSTTSDVTVKVNETVIHGAKSSHQDACGKPTASLRAVFSCSFVCVFVSQRGREGVSGWGRGKKRERRN